MLPDKLKKTFENPKVVKRFNDEHFVVHDMFLKPFTNDTIQNKFKY